MISSKSLLVYTSDFEENKENNQTLYIYCLLGTINVDCHDIDKFITNPSLF